MTTPSYHDLLRLANINHGKNPAIITYENGLYNQYTYNDLFNISLNIYDLISDKINIGENIGIIIGHDFLIPAIISAIHQCNASFIFLNPNNLENNLSIINDLNIHKIFSITNNVYDGFNSIDISHVVNIKNVELFLWNKSDIPKSNLNENFAYFIRTSGSTGIAKYVGVTHQCIYPNILDFESIFAVKSSDVIYFSTPLTFDPSVIELYLAAKCSAALMIAPNCIDAIFPYNSPYRITIWQTTPSKFRLFSDDTIRNRILNCDTSLRILALGGELLYYDLNKLIHENNKTEIFNLYGITEVSCWATIKKINNNDFNEYRCLGETLSDTMIKIMDENIFIGSRSRKCLVGDEISSGYKNTSDIIWRETGDLGISTNGSVYFKGRNDTIIKRYGHKINTQEIESTALTYHGIIQCVCSWDFKSLILFYRSELNIISKDLLIFLRSKLDKYSIPDSLIRLDTIPLNDHGKISTNKLKDLLKNDKNNTTCSKTIFLNLLENFVPANLLHDFTLQSFFDFGGTSISAIQLANNFESVVGKSCPKLYQSLIDSKISLFEIIESLDILNIEKNTNKRLLIENDFSRKKEKLTDANNLKLKIKMLWKFDTGKCVDANVTLFTDNSSKKTFILVGSHSGKVVILDAVTGDVLFDINVNSRVEAPIFCFKDGNSPALAVFGCYDGSLWCLSIVEPCIKWKVSLDDAMIKSQVCKIDDKIYAATYNSKLYKIDSNTGNTLSYMKIGSKGISADVVNLNEYVFIATLDGICAKIDTNTDAIIWKRSLDSPIFAKPVFIKNQTRIVVSEVNCKIHCFDVENGNLMWIFRDASGLIFSSCSVLSGTNSDVLAFGCHDRHTYKVTCAESGEPVVDWKFKNRSEVYATPFFYKSYAVSISTNGCLQVIDAPSGELSGEYFLPGEVFSSPAAKDDMIYAGCRDDNVYCMQIL